MTDAWQSGGVATAVVEGTADGLAVASFTHREKSCHAACVVPSDGLTSSMLRRHNEAAALQTAGPDTAVRLACDVGSLIEVCSNQSSFTARRRNLRAACGASVERQEERIVEGMRMLSALDRMQKENSELLQETLRRESSTGTARSSFCVTESTLVAEPETTSRTLYGQVLRSRLAHKHSSLHGRSPSATHSPRDWSTLEPYTFPAVRGLTDTHVDPTSVVVGTPQRDPVPPAVNVDTTPSTTTRVPPIANFAAATPPEKAIARADLEHARGYTVTHARTVRPRDRVVAVGSGVASDAAVACSARGATARGPTWTRVMTTTTTRVAAVDARSALITGRPTSSPDAASPPTRLTAAADRQTRVRLVPASARAPTVRETHAAQLRRAVAERKVAEQHVPCAAVPATVRDTHSRDRAVTHKADATPVTAAKGESAGRSGCGGDRARTSTSRKSPSQGVATVHRYNSTPRDPPSPPATAGLIENGLCVHGAGLVQTNPVHTVSAVPVVNSSPVVVSETTPTRGKRVTQVSSADSPRATARVGKTATSTPVVSRTRRGRNAAHKAVACVGTTSKRALVRRDKAVVLEKRPTPCPATGGEEEQPAAMKPLPFCTECGQRHVDAGAKFCAFCGHKRAIATR